MGVCGSNENNNINNRGKIKHVKTSYPGKNNKEKKNENSDDSKEENSLIKKEKRSNSDSN